MPARFARFQISPDQWTFEWTTTASYMARALATESAILLLGEPTASLDRQASTNIYELLRQLNEYMTILMISHDIGAVSSHIKTVGRLNIKLYYHGNHKVTREMLKKAYGGSVDQIVRAF